MTRDEVINEVVKMKQILQRGDTKPIQHLLMINEIANAVDIMYSQCRSYDTVYNILKMAQSNIEKSNNEMENNNV